MNVRIKHVENAMDAAGELMRAGYTIICPHLTHFLDLHLLERGIEIPYDKWLDMDIEIIKKCDAVIKLGSSPGADKECVIAKKLGIPVLSLAFALRSAPKTLQPNGG